MTSTGTLTLADFLLARTAEDEAVARDMQHQERTGRPLLQLLGGGTGIRRLVSPDFILAECEAKRRIVEIAQEGHQHDGDDITPWLMARELLQALALPYVDHPDYRAEWRP